LKPLRWITPETQGKPPCARYSHSMTHFPVLNIIAIYGGRNDDLYKTSRTPMLSDLWVLELDTLTWISVKLHGDVKGARCSHIAGAFGTKLLIFGGLSFNKYSSTDTHLIELDQNLAKKHQKNFDKKMASLPEVVPEKVNSTAKYTVDIMKVDPFDKYSGLLSFLPVPTKEELKKQLEIQEQERQSFQRKENRAQAIRFENLKRQVGLLLELQGYKTSSKK